MNAGVIVIAAAGNYTQQGHYPSEEITNDYNNYFTKADGIPIYYHRGGSPGGAPGVINVGASDTYQIVAGVDDPVVRDFETKALFSNCGPRVDVFAPGVNIMGAFVIGGYSLPTITDPRDGNYLLAKGQGTSMACPQVAGVLALAAQLDPTMNQAEAMAFIVNNAVPDRLAIDGGTYSVPNFIRFYNIHGAPNRYLYFPYSQSLPEGVVMLNFPSTPSMDQEYTVAGKTWKWNGTAWRFVPPPTVTSVNGSTGAVTVPSSVALSIIFGS